jgi:hypothetical protein
MAHCEWRHHLEAAPTTGAAVLEGTATYVQSQANLLL